MKLRGQQTIYTTLLEDTWESLFNLMRTFLIQEYYPGFTTVPCLQQIVPYFFCN